MQQAHSSVLVITIFCTDGKSNKHRYPFTTQEDLDRLCATVIDWIRDVFEYNRPIIGLINPSSTYATRHIVHIDYDVKSLNEQPVSPAVEQRVMGFVEAQNRS